MVRNESSNKIDTFLEQLTSKFTIKNFTLLGFKINTPIREVDEN